MAIEGVIYQPEGCDFHEDERRSLISPFNDDIENFVIRQAKALVSKGDCVLGSHWHPYRELFAMFGEATFILEDTKTKERETYNIKTKGRLLIPSGVAHIALVRGFRSVLNGYTEEPYSKERHDNKYTFENLPQEFLDLMLKPNA